MRVGFVIYSLRLGGAERVLSLLANQMSLENSVDIIKFDNKEPFYEINKSVKIINLPISNDGFLGNLKKRFNQVEEFLKVLNMIL